MVAGRHAGDDLLARGLVVALLVANTVFQKFAIPGGGGALPLSLLITALLLSCGVALGRLIPIPILCLGVVATAGILTLSTALTPASSFSLNALALVVALLVPYAFAFHPGSLDPAFSYRTFTLFAAVFAILGVLQFVAQFVIGAERAFWLDFNLPSDLLLAGFNNLNETGYQSGIYKANGVFLLEPAFLNQFLCVAVLIELCTTRRWRYLAIFGAGIVVTYSGTGLLMLTAIAPAYIPRNRHFAIAAGAVLGFALLFIFGEDLGLKLFLDRADEFSSDQSSAFARFFSIFYLLTDFAWKDTLSVLFGRGPGSVAENFTTVSYAAFDPSWGKLVYEYGIVGCLAYFALLGFCVLRSEGSGYLKAGLLLQFTFLGGYVATTPVHIEIWTLLVWPTLAAALSRRPARAGAAARQRAPAAGTWPRPATT